MIPYTVKRIAFRVRRDGIIRTLRLMYVHISDAYQEWRLGIRAGGLVASQGTYYNPTDFAAFKSIMRCISIHPGRDVFIDYGSGKGRVLVMAATYPFRRVIGVEISDEMNQIARRNVEKVRRRLTCTDVEVITLDATQYELPADVNVIYFFNPFLEEVHQGVMAQIEKSLRTAPRPVTLIYYGAQFADKMDSCGWLRRTQTLQFDRHKCVIFENVT